MSIEHFHPAALDGSTLQQIQALENELGVVLVAIEPDPEPAKLSPEQLDRIQAIEASTGKVLLAYDLQ